MNCALFELGQFAFNELSCFKNEKDERHLHVSNKRKLEAYPKKEKRKSFGLNMSFRSFTNSTLSHVLLRVQKT